MDHINLVETFSEFKEFKNIDRETMMRILEDVFKHMLEKRFGSSEGHGSDKKEAAWKGD